VTGHWLISVLYGGRWTSAEPLIWPGVLGGVAAALFSAGWSIALGAGRLRTCFTLDLTSAVLVAPALSSVFIIHDMRVYAWALVGLQSIASTIALSRASSLLRPGALQSAIWPPVCAGAAGSLLVHIFSSCMGTLPGIARLVLATVFYAIGALGTLRLFWPHSLRGILCRLPGASKFNRVLSLDSFSMEAAR
jgi:O-antigen/teichoic acid export membrane protein